MRESRFVFARRDPISEIQKRRERQTLFETGPFPLRACFPPNASDMQAPGLPPRPGADIFGTRHHKILRYRVFPGGPAEPIRTYRGLYAHH
jgi:hypothetical protein